MLVLTPRAQSGVWTSLSFCFFFLALTSLFSTCATDFAQKEKNARLQFSSATLFSKFVLATMQLSNICLPVQQMWTECENGGGERDNGWKKGTQLKGDEGVTFLTKLFSSQEWRWQPNRGWSWCGLALCSKLFELSSCSLNTPRLFPFLTLWTVLKDKIHSLKMA